MEAITTCIFCNSYNFDDQFLYDRPPEKEIIYNPNILAQYRRKVSSCAICGHFYSTHSMNLGDLYVGDYNSSNYSNIEGMHAHFQKITQLDTSKSDNARRCEKIDSFMQEYFNTSDKQSLSVLDIGSGLGVFPWKMTALGYPVLAFDPDQNAVQHIKEYLSIPAICGDYLKDDVTGLFSLITLNKVLEHVAEPIDMLKRTLQNLAPQGIVYVELPDGEVAARHGANREEFTIDHIHIFSLSSLSLLIDKAGFETLEISRVEEPSTKFTLRAFIKRN